MNRINDKRNIGYKELGTALVSSDLPTVEGRKHAQAAVRNILQQEGMRTVHVG